MLGEAPHLRGHEREPAPGLAGAGSLERAVEREQVAAVGDLVDQAQEVVDALDRGDTRAAMRLYAGPLLPTSQSPEIAEMRLDLRARVRRAALASKDADALMQFAVGQDGKDDVEVIQAALLALPTSSPKRIGLTARLERLHKMLAVPLPRLPGTGRAR